MKFPQLTNQASTSRWRRKSALAAAVGASLAITVGAVAPASAADIMRFEGIQAGSTAGTFSVAWVQAGQKDSGVKIQMSTGKPVTKAVLLGAQGKADLFLYTPGIAHFMKNQIVMFSKVKEAKELSKSLRGIMNFPLGPYHYIVWESSGIKSFNDLKGKKVFLGPPGGAAPNISSAFIEAVSGLKASEDYTLMRFDWTAGRTAFSDRQMDLTSFPTAVPSAIVQEYGASEKIRLLGLTKESLEHPKVKAVLKVPGRTLTMLDPSVYAPNVVNTEPLHSMQGWMGLATNNSVKEEAVYKMTKSFWENLKDVHATAAWMPTTVTPENALLEMNIPLHAGAYKYYKEAGWKVPDGIIPPEAK